MPEDEKEQDPYAAHFAAQKLWASRNTDQKPPDDKKFGCEEPPELTSEDEAILDRIWTEIAAENNNWTRCETMSDEETLAFFGLDPK